MLTVSVGPIIDINPASPPKKGQNAANCSPPSAAGIIRNKSCSWANKPWLLCAPSRLQLGTRGSRTSNPRNTPQLLLPNQIISPFTPLLCQKQQSSSQKEGEHFPAFPSQLFWQRAARHLSLNSFFLCSELALEFKGTTALGRGILLQLCVKQEGVCVVLAWH